MSKKLIRAFTLIELMVVIAIILILTAIITANFTSSKAKARDSQRISDLGQIQLALSLYFDRCNQYPSSISGDISLIKNGCESVNPPISLKSYIDKIPTPPPGASPTEAAYRYATNGSPATDYVLGTLLEKTNSSATANGLGADKLGVSCTGLNYCISSK